MKIIAFIIGFLLISTSFGSKTSHQQHLTASNLGQILKKTSLGNSLISLVNLYAKNMQNTNQENWTELFDALALLKESLLNKQQIENDDFIADGQEHTAEVTRISALLTGYRGEQAGLEFTSQQLQDKFDILSLELKNLEGQLDAAVTSRNYEQDYLEQAEVDFNNENADYQEAISLLNQAIEKLREAQESSNSAGFQAFLQTNQMNFQSFSVMVEKSIKKIPSSRIFFAQPITQVFTQLQNQQGVEPVRIQAAIDALSNLINHLSQGQIALGANYGADRTYHQNLLEQLVSEINSLTNDQIPQVQSNIDINRETNEINESALQQVLVNIRVEQGYLDEENQSWAQRQEIHDLLIPKLSGEYEIVVSAENILSSKAQQ